MERDRKECEKDKISTILKLPRGWGSMDGTSNRDVCFSGLTMKASFSMIFVTVLIVRLSNKLRAEKRDLSAPLSPICHRIEGGDFR